MRASQLIEPATDAEEQVRIALRSLIEAIIGRQDAGGEEPGPPADPLGVLPARIETDTPALLPSLRTMLQPLAVPVQLVEELPAVDGAAAELAEFLAGALAEPIEPFEWPIEPSLLPPLFRAARALYELAPWNQMPDHPPIMIELGEHGPEPGVPALFASVLGGASMVTGVALYYSAEGMHRALETGARLADEDEGGADAEECEPDLQSLLANIERMAGDQELTPRDLGKLLGSAIARAGAEADDALETEDSLVVYFDDREEASPTYLEWLKRHKISALPRDAVPTFFRVAPGGVTRTPNEREVRALTLVLRALHPFFKRFPAAVARMIETGRGIVQTTQIEEHAQKIRVTVTYPPPEEIWPEEYNQIGEPAFAPLEPASPTAVTTLYRFQVTFDGADPPIWRRIELRGDQTLHDLHEAIQEAFDWDDDHLYAFFLSRRAWDESSEYAGPYADSGENAAVHRLESLPLRPRKKFLYIFDFGDELRHTITVEAIVPGGAQAGVEYPRITERHGENVPQYPDSEGDDLTFLMLAGDEDGDDEDGDDEDGDDEADEGEEEDEGSDDR